MDSRRAPAIVRHQADQFTDLLLERRSTWTTVPGDPRPVATESFSVPPRHGVGGDDDQAARPAGPGGAECDPEGAVDIVQHWTRSLALERQDLLAKGEFSIRRSARGRNSALMARTPMRTRKASGRSMSGESVVSWAGLQPLGEAAFTVTLPSRNPLFDSRMDLEMGQRCASFHPLRGRIVGGIGALNSQLDFACDDKTAWPGRRVFRQEQLIDTIGESLPTGSCQTDQ